MFWSKQASLDRAEAVVHAVVKLLDRKQGLFIKIAHVLTACSRFGTNTPLRGGWGGDIGHAVFALSAAVPCPPKLVLSGCPWFFGPVARAALTSHALRKGLLATGQLIHYCLRCGGHDVSARGM